MLAAGSLNTPSCNERSHSYQVPVPRSLTRGALSQPRPTRALGTPTSPQSFQPAPAPCRPPNAAFLLTGSSPVQGHVYFPVCFNLGHPFILPRQGQRLLRPRYICLAALFLHRLPLDCDVIRAESRFAKPGRQHSTLSEPCTTATITAQLHRAAKHTCEQPRLGGQSSTYFLFLELVSE
ncbi:hypothetical protein L209DRAFT_318493 [Thermothelomyces heterothallicus CBS 203.75]